MANHPGDTESRVAVLVDCGHKVSVGRLGSCLERADPSFSPKSYGHSGWWDMLKTYDLLTVQQEMGGHWTTRLAEKSST